MEIAVSVLLIIFSYLFIKWYLKNRRYVKLMKIFPSPPTVPIFGNALSFKTQSDFIPNFAEYTKLYGDKVTLYFGMFPNMLLISDFRLLTHVLSLNDILKKGKEYTFLERWLGDGLLTTNLGNRWKNHRKHINPSFHIQILKEFIEIFQSNVNILIRKLEKEVGKPSFNIDQYIAFCSLDNICETAMGTSIYAQDNAHSAYVKSVKFMCNLTMKRGFNPFYRTDFFYNFTKLYRDEKRAVQILQNYTKDVIKQRKDQRQRHMKNNLSDLKGKSKMVLLDMLLQLNEQSETFTDIEIEEEVNTFMFAGHDTVSSALNFAIFTLAANPAVQAKVLEELHEIFAGDKGRSLTLNDIQSMRYLEAVLKEVLRLYPSVPYISRIVDEDFEFDGYTIPKGSTLILNIYGIHHDAKLFSEPDSFKPERFLGEHVEERSNYGYLPFSFGPRNCIGQKFAMIEMKTMLAVLLQHYEFVQATPFHRLQLSTEAVLLSKNGVCVSIIKRNS